jgi:hypothetical protein
MNPISLPWTGRRRKRDPEECWDEPWGPQLGSTPRKRLPPIPALRVGDYCRFLWLNEPEPMCQQIEAANGTVLAVRKLAHGHLQVTFALEEFPGRIQQDVLWAFEPAYGLQIITILNRAPVTQRWFNALQLYRGAQERYML